MTPTKPFSVLVIDDDKAMATLLARILREEGFCVSIALDIDQARALLQKESFSFVLCDINLGKDNGLDLLASSKPDSERPLFIFITGQASVQTAISALRDGAFDYLSKPDDLDQIESQLRSVMDRATRALLQKSPGHAVQPITAASGGKTLIGRSSKIVEVYRAIAKAALFRGNVLIRGETGTGKELIAKAIHTNSEWRSQPFVTVNCGALTDTLLESELFGHVKGSFTGAIANKPGLFEEADGGTLFLDEIGDVSPALQVKLLRAIQEGEIRAVGSVTTKKVNVRVIAATHQNLEEEIRQLRFREDLYYRLKVFSIEVPPLRDRLEDLPELVMHFVSEKAGRSSKNITGISEDALDRLKEYTWPGNIRELENAVTRAVAASQSTVLFPEEFPPEISRPFATAVSSINERAEGESQSELRPPTLAEVERDYIVKVLKKVNFRKKKAAELLGIDRVTLYRKVARYAITSELDQEEGEEAASE